ncbi:hypothetical protein KGY77_09205 [Candidatus Bipolaricaulota bacterium]|nr:hypothetical protein [Candidatus Bipolaricaulota bacterium]MBS3792806.1 hypothetical protein [Candidatus Bipolaricaulota bacterium]
MKGERKETFYFERPGPVNTEKALELGIDRGSKLGLDYLVVPSITGKSALKAAKLCQDATRKWRVVCVAFMAGGAWEVSEEPPDGAHWREIPKLKSRWENWKEMDIEKVKFDPEIREKLEQRGVPVIQTTDLGYEISSSMANHLGVSTQKTIMKETLYLLSPGVKVAVFTTLSAADAGVLPVDEEVVAFGGLEQGLDTAAVISPAYSGQVFHPRKGLEVREVICKPRSMMGSSGEYYGRAWGGN